MRSLSQLLDQALTEIQARPDIQALGNDAETEAIINQLPYDKIVEIELYKEVFRADVAEKLLQRLQAEVLEAITVYNAHIARLQPKLNHPLLPEAIRTNFTEKFKQNGRKMIRNLYMVSGVSEATAQALAELQIP